MSSLIAGLDEGRKEVFLSLAELGRELGFSIYLVGGSVRDELLGTQVLDLDFSVVGDGVAIGKRLAEQSGGKLTVHSQLDGHCRYARSRASRLTRPPGGYPGPGASAAGDSGKQSTTT